MGLKFGRGTPRTEQTTVDGVSVSRRSARVSTEQQFMKITLKWDGESGDGKRAFVVAKENDGYQDVRIELDTDDCDKKHARKVMNEIIRRCNRANKKP